LIKILIVNFYYDLIVLNTGLILDCVSVCSNAPRFYVYQPRMIESMQTFE